jgi:hypothetical protein
MPAMPLNQQTKYPSRRTYVLKVRSDAKPDALAGRLENIVTGRQREFASSEELLDSIANDLKAAANEPSMRPERA